MRRPPSHWGGVAEDQIRDAMERGEFDNLAGSGKPVDLDENPFTPPHWRLAYKLLKDAGAAPEWIEEERQVRIEIRNVAEALGRSARAQRDCRARARRLPPDRMIAVYQSLSEARDQAEAQFRERAAALNRVIDTFNLKAPSPWLHFARIAIEEEIRRYRDACRR